MGAFQTMVDMARTPVDVKKEIKAMSSPPISPDATAPVYPYGLCLTLTQDELDKLGLDGDCGVGDMIHLAAMAKVTSCSESERETADGKKEKTCRIELQITHLATENEDEEGESMSAEARAGRRYGAGEANEED